MPEHKNQINNCDGCQRGLPIKEDTYGKIHVSEAGMMTGFYCTKDRYVPTEHKCKEDFDGLCYVCEKNMLVPTTDQELREKWEKEYHRPEGFIVDPEHALMNTERIADWWLNELRLAVDREKEKNHDYYQQGRVRGSSEIGAQVLAVSEAVKKERETTANDLKQILNRCKTERGLGTAIANFIRSREQ